MFIIVSNGLLPLVFAWSVDELVKFSTEMAEMTKSFLAVTRTLFLEVIQISLCYSQFEYQSHCTAAAFLTTHSNSRVQYSDE